MTQRAQCVRQMRCRTCGYDLRHLEGRRCPECGREFDPSSRATFLTEPVRGLRLLALAGLSVALLAVPLLFAQSVALHRLPVILGTFAILLGPTSLIAGATLGGYIADRCFRILHKREPWVRHRGAVVPAMVIGGGAFAFFILGMLGITLQRLL